MRKNINLRQKATVTGLAVMGLVVASPAVASAATTTTTVSTTIGSVISLLTSNGTVNVNVVPTGAGATTIASDTITVSTNNAAGYTLQIAETTTDSNLTSGPNIIPNTSGTQASPAALTTNQWGYRVDGVGGFGAGPTAAASSVPIPATTFAQVPATASPDTIKTANAPVSSDTTTVWYGVAVDTTKPSGTYTNSVTYTATAN